MKLNRRSFFPAMLGLVALPKPEPTTPKPVFMAVGHVHCIACGGEVYVKVDYEKSPWNEGTAQCGNRYCANYEVEHKVVLSGTIVATTKDTVMTLLPVKQ